LAGIFLTTLTTYKLATRGEKTKEIFCSHIHVHQNQGVKSEIFYFKPVFLLVSSISR
jgi:N-glycosylase/DNA lyase